jgi:hypothetical protein
MPDGIIVGMKNTTKKSRTKDLVPDTLFDGGIEEDADTHPAEDKATPPAPPPIAITPEVIHPHQYHLRTEFDYKPGEDGWGYLSRITPHLLKELVAMATAPISVISPKVKLDALRELIQRPMPARQVYDINTPHTGSEFDRMTDSQVMDFVHKQITDMRKEEEEGCFPERKAEEGEAAITAAAATPED